MYLGKTQEFGMRFEPPEPSSYLTGLLKNYYKYQRSKITLALIRADIKENTINSNAKRPKDYLLDEAIRRTASAFQLREHVPLIHLNDVFKQDLPIWSSSPGLPWTNLGYRNKAAIRDDPDAVQRVHIVLSVDRLSILPTVVHSSDHTSQRQDAKKFEPFGVTQRLSRLEKLYLLYLSSGHTSVNEHRLHMATSQRMEATNVYSRNSKEDHFLE